MKKIKKYLIVLLVGISLISCQDHKMYYDLEKQELVSCNNISFTNINIKDEVSITWKDSLNEVPKKINLNNLPNGYIISDGIKIKKFKLKSLTHYSILKSGMGLNSHSIEIWTDSKGKVYKTSNPNCTCNDGVSEEWIQ